MNAPPRNLYFNEGKNYSLIFNSIGGQHVDDLPYRVSMCACVCVGHFLLMEVVLTLMKRKQLLNICTCFSDDNLTTYIERNDCLAIYLLDITIFVVSYMACVYVHGDG